MNDTLCWQAVTLGFGKLGTIFAPFFVMFSAAMTGGGMITRSAVTLIFSITRAVYPDEPLSSSFVTTLDGLTTMFTYSFAGLGMVVMLGMAERVRAMKDGVKEEDLPPGKGPAKYIAEVKFFKYVLREANKIESSIQISDSFADAEAQTNELNDCGRKVVNVTEHNTEDFTCDTADLISRAEFAGGWETPAEWKEEVVAVVLHLDMNYEDIAADEKNFAEEVREDVLRAAGAGVKPDQIKIKGVRSGSVLVDLEVTGGVVSADKVAKSLMDQVGSPNSLLLKGKHTCRTKSLAPQDASAGAGEGAVKAAGTGNAPVREVGAGEGPAQEMEGKLTPRQKFGAVPPPNVDSLDGGQGMDARTQGKGLDASGETSAGLQGGGSGSGRKAQAEDGGSRSLMLGATDFLPTPSPAPAPVSKGGNDFLSAPPTSALDELPGMDEVLSKPSPVIASSKQAVEMREMGSKAVSDNEGGPATLPTSEAKMEKLLPQSNAASLELSHAASPESVGGGKRSSGAPNPQVRELKHLEGAAGAPSLSPVAGGDDAGSGAGARGAGIFGMFGRRPGLRPQSAPLSLSSSVTTTDMSSAMVRPLACKKSCLARRLEAS